MPDASVSFAGNLTDDPELRHTESGIARAVFRVAVSGRREQEGSFFTVVVWRGQAEHAAQSLSKGAAGWWWVDSSSASAGVRGGARPGPPQVEPGVHVQTEGALGLTFDDHAMDATGAT